MQTTLSPAHPESGKLDSLKLEERIRDRAYQIYEERQCEQDHALDHWLQAKLEVLGVVRSPISKHQKSA